MKKDINKSVEEVAGLAREMRGLGPAATHEDAADGDGRHAQKDGAGRMPAAHGDTVSQSGIPPQAVGHQDGPFDKLRVKSSLDQEKMSGPQGSRPTEEVADGDGRNAQKDGAGRMPAAHGDGVSQSGIPPQAVGHQEGPSRENVHRMFDRIAPRYDLLNHLLSFNRDKVWRRRMTTMLPVRPDLKLLDLATGTGDQLLALYDSGKIASGVGIDPAEKMLAIGREKIARRSLGDRLSLAMGAGESIPCADKTFDVVTISFGIRNVTDVPKALREMRRVLKPDGRALILEFSLPQSTLIRAGYLFYFRHILPTLGGWISGDKEAYRYLNKTVESFPYGDQFTKLMREAGFESVKATPLTFGVASIYQGDKR